MKRVPFVPQLEAADCGAACLGMVLALHGRTVPREQIRSVMGTGGRGVDAQTIVETARWFGLDARGVRADVAQLAKLARGAVLHWEHNHFVVLDRVRPDGADIVDPARGRRRIRTGELASAYTGVAIALQPGPEFVRAKAPKRGAWRYLLPLARRSAGLSRILATSLLMRIFALVIPVLTGVLVDRIVPESDRHLLVVLGAGLVAMVGYFFVAFFVRAHLLVELRTKLDLRLMTGFVRHLADLPYSFFLTRSSGDLLSRANSQTTVREILTTSTLSAALDGVLVATYLVLMLVLDLPMGALTGLLGGVQVAVLVATRSRNERLMAERLQATAKSQSYLVELLSGIESLKASGAEPRAVEHWTKLFVREVNVGVARGRLEAVVDAALSTLRLGSPLLVLLLGGFQVLDGRLSLGTMLALSSLAAGALGPLGALVTTGLQLQLLGTYMERLNDVFDTPAESTPAQRPAHRITGAIRARGVCFRYGPLAPLVVHDVSVAIRPGQKVAVVGQSGAGKSTLAHLLLGLFPPTDGTVEYDGVDIAALEPRSVRSQIGIVTQRPYVFGTSVRENVTIADPALSMDAVERAARLAVIHDDIAAMPMRYETVLTDGGASLSGGQRQRIALARALVHQPRVLLLDEATSALDALTERRVYDNLRTLECTVVIIAHRLSTIAQADEIVVMHAGRIVERGRHQELLAAGGRYSDLVFAQVAGETVDPR